MSNDSTLGLASASHGVPDSLAIMEAPEAQASKPNTAQELVEIGKKAFDPSLDDAAREAGLQEYNVFVEK